MKVNNNKLAVAVAVVVIQNLKEVVGKVKEREKVVVIRFKKFYFLSFIINKIII